MINIDKEQAIEQNLLLFKETDNVVFYLVAKTAAETYGLTHFFTEYIKFCCIESKVLTLTALDFLN